MNAKEKIENAFMDLIKTKKVNNITITEICNKAAINRTTFYDNYQSLRDLILSRFNYIIDELFNHILNGIDLSQKNIATSIISKFLEIMKSNRELTIQLMDFENNEFIQLSTKKLKSLLLSNQDKKIIINKKDISFFKGGCDRIIYEWLINNCETPTNELSNFIVTIMHNIFDKYWS